MDKGGRASSGGPLYTLLLFNWDLALHRKVFIANLQSA